jgi:hypothetical protein
MARISAPGIQRQQENQGVDRLGSSLGGMSRDAAASQFLSELRARTRQRSPWLDAAGGIATGAAAGMAGRGTAPKNALDPEGLARVEAGATRYVEPPRGPWRTA